VGEVTGGWRKMHNEELHNLYCLQTIIRTIKTRRMRWARHEANMGKNEVHTKFWKKAWKERDN
jgi:hypothetical protein